MKKVAGYIRVSTEEQSREGCSLTMQREKITAYCLLHDLELVGIFEDAGISAKSIDTRPAFMTALESVYTGKADGLIVFKLDRAFRSTQDALAVAQKLQKRGKALISVTEQIDTNSALGGFFFTLMASLAEMERKLVGERTKAALQSKKARGERVGEIEFGYRLADNRVTLEEDPAEQAIIHMVVNLASIGHSHRAIARHLNSSGILTRKGTSWGHQQVANILRRAA